MGNLHTFYMRGALLAQLLNQESVWSDGNGAGAMEVEGASKHDSKDDQVRSDGVGSDWD